VIALLGQREEDFVLAGEVAVDGRRAVFDALGDLAHRDVPVALGEEEITGGAQNRLAHRVSFPFLSFLYAHRFKVQMRNA
jgi:hypothetical protein